MKSARLFLYLFIAALVAGSGFLGWRRFGAPPQVSVAEVKRGSVAEVVYATGVVEPTRWAKVIAYQRKRIVDICDCEGKSVKAGDVLARLDDTEEKANLAELEARRALLKNDVDRVTGLYKLNATTKTALDQAVTALQEYDARIDARRMGEAFGLYFDTVGRLDMAAVFNLPEWVPTLGRLRARPALRFFQGEVGRIVAERRALMARDPAAAPDDLLTMLLTARDPEDGRPMDEQQVIDNAITFIGAGHETTANALCWTLYLLSAFPWAEARVSEELERVLGGRTPAAADIDGLVYLRQVLDEAMRLYPPAPFLGREAVGPDELGGAPVRPGTQIIVSPWILHRHRTLWDEPELFDPERFAPERREAIHRFAFIPFGAGPRICIGMAFALQEAMLLLAVILQRYRLTVRPGFTVMPLATITLRPKGGLPMRLERRA